jgi:hypothetical protein
MNNLLLNTAMTLVLLWMLTILAGCEDIYYDLPPEKRAEFKSGDRFLFQSETGEKDTLEASVWETYEVFDKKVHYEHSIVSFKKVTKGVADEQVFLISYMASGGSASTSERLDSYTLGNGQQIHGVYHFTETDPTKKWIEFYYHCRIGLVKYVRNSGVIMELQVE